MREMTKLEKAKQTNRVRTFRQAQARVQSRTRTQCGGQHPEHAEAGGLGWAFMTVGTHAMYAYESACGVVVGTEALATRDMDLLFDSRKRLSFVSSMQRMDTSLVGLLRRVDPNIQ
jgi:hypothetical protein